MKILKKFKDIFIYGCDIRGKNLLEIVRKFLAEVRRKSFFETVWYI